MSDTDIPFINLDGVTPKVDKPVGINFNNRKIAFAPFANDLQFSNIDLDKYSKYFKNYGGVYPDFQDINEFRASTQRTSEKWLNGLVKFGGKVGTSFLEPYIDFTYGVGAAISKGKFSAMFDNEITQSFDAFNDYLSKNFPNYYTQREQNSATLSPYNWFTANFWADKVMGGAAFTVGTLLNAYATMGIATALKGTQLGLKVGTVGAKAALATKKQLGKLGKESIEEIIAKGSAYKFKNASEAFATSLFSVTGEAGLEARELGKQLRADLQPLVEKGEISQSAADLRVEEAMAIAFASNVAIVGTSQFLQFGKLFQRGYVPNKARLNAIVKDGEKFVQKLPETGFGKFIYKTTGARIAVRDMLTEAKEEGLQYLTQKTLESKYGEEVIKDNVTALHDGMKELFTTKEGQENMLIGAILGAGSHLGKLIGSSKVEPYNRIRETSTGKAVDLLNKHFTKNDNLLNKLAGNAGTQIAATERKEYYLSKDDIFNYKNEEATEFAAVVKSFSDLGALDTLNDQIDVFAGMSQSEFDQIINPHKDATVYKPKEEFIREVKDKIKRYSTIHQSIENRFYDRLPSYRSNLYFAAVAVEDMADREIKIKNEIKDKTGIDYSDFAALRSRQYYERAKDKLKETSGEGEQKKEEKIPTENKEIFDNAFKGALLDWIGDHKKEVSEADINHLDEMVSDLSNIHNRRQNFLDTYNYLLSPEGQENTNTEKVVKEVTEQNKELTKKFNDKLDKLKKDKSANKLNNQELDKAIADALSMYNVSGDKTYKKIADELISLVKEDPIVSEEAKEQDISSFKGDQKEAKKEEKKKAVAKAKKVSNKKEKVVVSKEEEVKTAELDKEIDKVNVPSDTKSLIIEALKKAIEYGKENPNVEDDTSYNSTKRSPVKGETTKSLIREVVDLFELLFDKNSPVSLYGKISPELYYNFSWIMKYFNALAKEAGIEITPVVFQIVKGQFTSFVHSINPNADLYANYLNKFTYEGLQQYEFTHDNRFYVTIAKKDSVGKQRAEFSEEGRLHETPATYYPTMHSTVNTLNRAYKEKNGHFIELDNNLINPNNLNYDQVRQGSIVTMRIPESISYKKDGVLVTGAKILNKVKEGQQLTLDEIRQLPIEFIREDGKVIGMLHDENTVKIKIKGEKHNEERKNQLNKLLQIRALVYNKGSFDTTISMRTNGKLFVRIDTSTNEAKQTTAIYTLKDPNLEFAVGDEVDAKGELRVAPSKFADKDKKLAINKDKVISGITYALLPVNKDANGEYIYIPAPMQSMRPKDYEYLQDVEMSKTTVNLKEFADRTVDTVMSAIEIFLNKENLNAEQTFIINNLKAQGYDISNIKGLKKYVNNFFYIYDNIYDLDDDKVGGAIRTYMKNSKHIGNSILNISEFYIGFGEIGQDNLFLARVYKKGISTHSLNVDSNIINNNNKIDTEVFLRGLRANLNTQFFRTNLNLLNDNKKFSLPIIHDGQVESVSFNNYNEYLKQTLRSDVMGIYNEEDKMYHYSIQPTITTNTDYLSETENLKIIEETIKASNNGILPDGIITPHLETKVKIKEESIIEDDVRELEDRLETLNELLNCVG